MRVVPQDYDPAVPVGDLRPHPANARQGDIGVIYQSIKENGFYDTVKVQRSTGMIIAGEHRWRAAMESGATHIPVMWMDVDDASALKMLLVDNRASDQATWNPAHLVKALEITRNNHPTGLAGSGFSEDDYADILKSAENALKMSQLPEVPGEKKPKVSFEFDSPDQLAEFKTWMQALREQYAVYDSDASRLIALFREALPDSPEEPDFEGEPEDGPEE